MCSRNVQQACFEVVGPNISDRISFFPSLLDCGGHRDEGRAGRIILQCVTKCLCLYRLSGKTDRNQPRAAHTDGAVLRSPDRSPPISAETVQA